MELSEKILTGKTTIISILLIVIILLFQYLLPIASSSQNVTHIDEEKLNIITSDLKTLIQSRAIYDSRSLTIMERLVDKFDDISKTQERIVLIQQEILKEVEKMERYRKP